VIIFSICSKEVAPKKLGHPEMTTQKDKELADIRTFYESIYYKSLKKNQPLEQYHLRLARRLQIKQGSKVLDVACGLGGWLRACSSLGAEPFGVDISTRAISLCQEAMPQGSFLAQPAETLPYPDTCFDVITCLGSLEHFVEPVSALREMARTAKPGASILIVVPNSNFIARKVGIYNGTQQTAAKEEARPPHGWVSLFNTAGITPIDSWSDLHMLSWSWITQAGWLKSPLRALQALCMPFIPLRWQYQITYLCKVTQSSGKP
jgi:ubiquinone/menaquinone biosynthesis C-methylase UbiE